MGCVGEGGLGRVSGGEGGGGGGGGVSAGPNLMIWLKFNILKIVWNTRLVALGAPDHK